MFALLLSTAFAGERVTLLHTNDRQSRLLGVPNVEYSPETAGDDAPHGGVARLAAVVDARRAATDHPVLLVDAGDITMGSLFHLVARETGGELQLMARLGYDGATLGNHDFDRRPNGLADMITAARDAQAVPPLVASNPVLDPTDPRDNRLQALFDAGVVQDRLLVTRGGLTVGMIGLLGRDATEVMGQAWTRSSPGTPTPR